MAGHAEYEHLGRAVDALERGDWRTAKGLLLGGVDARADEESVDLAVALRRVCRCQWLQCAYGDVQRAQWELDRATEALVRTGVRAPGGRLLLDPEPPLGQVWSHLVWSTTRLVVRERADLDVLRVIFGRIRKGAPELVYAFAEHLTWVEFDPWTAHLHEHDQELLGLDGEAYTRFRTANPQDLSTRATSLRHLANVRTGTVAARTWSRCGGFAALRSDALRVLADEPRTRVHAEWPVRRGRSCAWNYARCLHKEVRGGGQADGPVGDTAA